MPTRVSPEEALRLTQEEGYVLVDVRTVPEFEAGHPAGAYNVPVVFIEASGRVPNPRFVETMQKHFEPGTKIVLACQAGARSMHAAGLLEAAGYHRLVDQRAGWGGAKDSFGAVVEKGWSGLGLPTETGDGGAKSHAALSR